MKLKLDESQHLPTHTTLDSVPEAVKAQVHLHPTLLLPRGA
jgi:hypothetical protein